MRVYQSGIAQVIAVLVATAGCGDNQTTNAAPSDDGGVSSPEVAPDAVTDAATGTATDAASPPLGTEPLSCDVKWQDFRLATDQDDELWGMATDKLHHLYVGGFENGVTGITNIEPAGNSRGVVIQIDTAGTGQWKAVLDTSGTDTVEDVATDPATGWVYAVGRTSGAFPGFVNQGQFDTFLTALRPQGTVASMFQSGDERPQHPARISLGPDSIAVAGYDDVYIPTNHVVSQEDGFIASFRRGQAVDPTFTQTYVQKVPLTASNRLRAVTVDHDGSGRMYITSYVGAGPRASVGIFVKKLNRDGSQGSISALGRSSGLLD